MKHLTVKIPLFVLSLCFFQLLIGQDDLLDMLDETEPEKTEITQATFKTTRVINLHSTENMAKRELDIKINHRFGFINTGIEELFGLDNAMIRIGADYGITDNIMIGFGRSSYEKTYDGFVKYKFLRQSTGLKNMPVTVAFMASTAIKTADWPDETRDNYFTSRMFYTFQINVGRKFSEKFSMILTPSLVHRNLVATKAESNDVMAIGVGGRYKITKRTSINAEYIYVLPDQLAEEFTNSLSIGVDIETGGHVFQIHLTNSTSMIEKGFVTENRGDFFDGDIHLGFNVARIFSF